MDYTDLKYINLICSRLENFKQKSSEVYNFKCPFCNDGHHGKRRGYIFWDYKNNLFFNKCFNCSQVLPFSAFIKRLDETLYLEYRKEKFFKDKNYKKSQPNFLVPEVCNSYDTSVFNELMTIEELDWISPIKQFIMQRQIPFDYWDKLFYCDKFKAFTNKLLPNKFKENEFDEPRIIIPFFDENKKIFAYSGRSLRVDSKMRYIQIRLNKDIPSIFGLERWNKTQPTIVVEGEFDSLFLPNCIATAGGELISALKGFDKSIFTIVYDNEKRSKETREKINRAILAGYKVCIWHHNVKSKDINKMILDGYKTLDILRIIEQNTFSGTKAGLELCFWK